MVAAGSYAPAGSTAPIECASGMNASAPGRPRCTTCVAGTYANRERTECDDCSPGHWCNAGQKFECALGLYAEGPPRNRTSLDACLRCPPQSATATAGAHGRDTCLCQPDWYDAGQVECMRCPLGTRCDGTGTTLATLPIGRGFFRTSPSSDDVRRCPDAAAGCTGSSNCEYSTSGCLGAPTACREGLEGIFCRGCSQAHGGVYYVAATADAAATCRPCNDAGPAIGVAAT